MRHFNIPTDPEMQSNKFCFFFKIVKRRAFLHTLQTYQFEEYLHYCRSEYVPLHTQCYHLNIITSLCISHCKMQQPSPGTRSHFIVSFLNTRFGVLFDI